MKTGLLFSASMFGAYQLLNSTYSGVVVARLPFEAPGLVRRLTHAGLEGEDYYDCSASFIFMTSFLVLRTLFQKAMGWAPPRVAQGNPFEPKTK
jgi:hypothetical protein